MIPVDQLVGELLLRHNCVIVPSFGGFIAKKKSATIDYATGTMSPPSKSLLFNRQLINNDGLLVADLAYRNKISYEQAVALVDQQIKDWNNTLNNGARVVIDKVGFLFLDGEKNICFEQDRFFNLLLESYGLGKVIFLAEEDVSYAQQTVIQQQIANENTAPVIILNSEPSVSTETIDEVDVQEPQIIAHPELKKRSTAWKYIAAACFLPIAFYSYWIPVQTDFLASGVLKLDHFNPFASQPTLKANAETISFKEKHEPALEVIQEEVNNSEDESNAVSEITSTTVLEPINEIKTEQQVVLDTKTFDYIIGSFSNPINAQKKIDELKTLGLQPFVKETSGGMTRVSLGTATNASELEKITQDALNHGIKGWVLKK